MGTYTPVDPNLTGAVPAMVAVAASDQFQNNGRCLLHVKNASGGSINVTITDQGSIAPANASAFTPSVVVAVGAGAEKYIGPFLPARFNDANGLVQVGYSGITTVTAEVLDAT